MGRGPSSRRADKSRARVVPCRGAEDPFQDATLAAAASPPCDIWTCFFMAGGPHPASSRGPGESGTALELNPAGLGPPPPLSPTTNKLAIGMGRDAAWTSLTLILSTAAYFPLLAYIVQRLGTADLGLFTVISSVTALLSIADFSFGTAVVRSTALEAATSMPSERDAARNGVATAHSALVAIGLVVAVAAMPLAYLLPAITIVPAGSRSSVLVCTVLVGLAAAVGLGSASLSGVIRGSRRFAVFALSTLAGVAVRCVLVVFLVGRFGLVSLGIAQLASVCVERGVQAVWIRRNVRWFQFRPGRVSLSALRQTASFAVPLVILSIDAQIVAASDAIIIGAMVGASGVGLYRIGSVIPRQVTAAIITAFTVSFPSFASTTDRAEQTALMRSLTRVACYLAGLAFAFTALFRADLVQLLLGRSNPTAEAVLLILSVTFAFDISVHGMALVLTARGRQWIMAVLSPVQLSLNLVLTVLLVKEMGPEGAAVAALLTFVVIDLVLFPYVARREFCPSARRIIAVDGLLPAVLGGVVCALGASAVRYLLDPSWERVLMGAGVVALCGLAAGLLALGPGGRTYLRSALRR